MAVENRGIPKNSPTIINGAGDVRMPRVFPSRSERSVRIEGDCRNDGSRFRSDTRNLRGEVRTRAVTATGAVFRSRVGVTHHDPGSAAAWLAQFRIPMAASKLFSPRPEAASLEFNRSLPLTRSLRHEIRHHCLRRHGCPVRASCPVGGEHSAGAWRIFSVTRPAREAGPRFAALRSVEGAGGLTLHGAETAEVLNAVSANDL